MRILLTGATGHIGKTIACVAAQRTLGKNVLVPLQAASFTCF